MRTYKLYLIRHGFTQGNLDGRYVGTTDLDLCEEGVSELLSLKEQFEYPNVGRVYASPFKRCVETARLLYPGIRPVTVSDIREYSFGVFENKTPEELKNDPTYQEWMKSAQSVIPEGAEDMEEFKLRILMGFDTILMDMMKDRVTDAAVITHAGVISSFLSRCGLPERKFADWTVESGKGYTLLVNASLWSNAHKAEVFTPVPYGTGQDEIMLDYQKAMPDEETDLDWEEA